MRAVDPQSSGGTTVTQKADVVYEPGDAPGVLIHKEPGTESGGSHIFGNTKTTSLGLAKPEDLPEEVRRQLKVGEFAEPEEEVVVEAETVSPAADTVPPAEQG